MSNSKENMIKRSQHRKSEFTFPASRGLSRRGKKKKFFPRRERPLLAGKNLPVLSGTFFR